MRIPRFLSIALLCCYASMASFGQAQSGAQAAFEFLDGDRVVLLGDTLIEREPSYGYWESRIVSRFPDRKITIRNLGWSADTVLGQSRVSFDWSKPEDEWFAHLKGQIAAIKPTVAILGYGMAASFDGQAGIEQFKKDLNRLMGAIQEISGDKPVRFILLSPIRHEDLGGTLPDPAGHNEQLALYTRAIQEIASEHQSRFVSFFTMLPYGGKGTNNRALTDNGIHLNEYGYYRAAGVLEAGLGWGASAWRVDITPDGSDRSTGIRVSNLSRQDDRISFSAIDDVLAKEMFSAKDGAAQAGTSGPVIQIGGLKPGDYTLRVDGVAVATQSAEAWGKGQSISGGAELDQASRLRATIVKKDELYFYRWRPQNETYLFGFRKYEQGQNAREIPMFDPLVSAEENKIAQLAKPIEHKYELVREQEPKRVQIAPTGAAKLSASPSGTAEATPAKPQPLPTFEIEPGFEISLYAESPILAKPIQINFDPKGRLWVASSSVYPQIQPGQEANDKILILEDTDGDGKVDKSTVFAEGLLIPTGVEPGDGGAYVGQSTELLHFKDTDGDGKADEKRIILSGLGTEDTHHIVHTLRWGHDGQLYFNQSIYIHSHFETPHGVVRLNSGGILHLRPPTMELGVFLKGFINPWGHDFDAFGQSFVTDGAGGDGINYGVPGAMYVTYSGARRILGSVSPGSYPKFCSLEIIRSEHFPSDWQGSLITCDFRAHRVVRFTVNEKDSSYLAKEMPDLLRSSDISFRPIDVKLGPDGALYIADWSNPIIQHGEVDFRDARRDHEHGRIWRVTAKGRPLLEKPRLADASNAALLDQLLSPNAYNQQQARRVLTERGDGIVADLAAWTQRQSVDSAKMEALWMYQSIDRVNRPLLDTVLASKDGRIRAAGTRVLSFWSNRIENPLDLLSRLVADENPRVRLEAIRALSGIPTARSAELALSILDKPMDNFLDYGLWLTINDLAKPWIESVRSGEWKVEGHERQVEFGLQAIEPATAGPLLGQLIESGKIRLDGTGPWIDLVGKAGTESELKRLFDLALSGGASDEVRARALGALDQAARLRQLKPSDNLQKLGDLLKASNDKVLTQATRLAGAWKLAGLVPVLLDQARNQGTKASLQQASFESLREISSPEAVQGLRSLATKGNSASTRRHAVAALASADLNQAAPLALEVFADTADEAEALALWRSLLANKGAAAVFAKALSKATLSPAVAKAGMRAAREGGRKEPQLVLAIAQSGNLEEGARELTAAEIQQMVATIAQKGDPARGEKIFRRAELSCTVCHSIGGVGGKVGPDLTSIGASAPVDYLIESLLYPNRKVKEGYHSVVIETKDGQEFSGIPVRETTDQVVMRDISNREVAIAKNNIQNRTVGGSIMPSGLLENLNNEEQIDLYRFLSELGKPGPYDASRGNVARFWKLLPETIDIAQFGAEKVVNGGVDDSQWSPAFALVDGRLLREELKAKLASIAYRDPASIYAAARFQVAKSGNVRMRLSEGKPLGVWIDGKTVAPGSEINADLASGAHTIVVKLDAKNLPDFVRLETDDGTFSSN